LFDHSFYAVYFSFAVNILQICKVFGASIGIFLAFSAFRYKGALDADLVTRAICSGFVQCGDSDLPSGTAFFFDKSKLAD